MKTIVPEEKPSFLQGGGEMGDLTRRFPWAQTSLGLPDQWPQSLQTTLGILLHSAFPMFLFWGDELTCFYNDAFRPSLGVNGKHPALGKPGREVWAEIWDFIGSLIQEVMATGSPVWYEDQLVPIYRNGRLEDVYWTFSYSPVYDDNGQINGVFVTCTETTTAVLERRSTKESELFTRTIIEQSPVAKAIFVGPNMVTRIVNQKMLEVLGQDSSMIGKPFPEAIPSLAHTQALQVLQHVYQTGQALYQHGERYEFMKQGRPHTGYYDLTYVPLRDTQNEIYGVINTAVDVTEQVLTRHKIEESEAKFRQLSAELDSLVQERTQQLQATVQDLQRSNQNLEQFAYIASHDLQEPLRKIQAFSDVLKDQYGPQLGDGIDHIHRMRNAATRMSTLIRDLLAYSRISTQQEANTLVPLTDVVGIILNELELSVKEAGATFSIEPLPVVQGEPSQLGQLFQNLLSNALKFRRPSIPPMIRIGVQQVPSANLPASVRPARPAAAYHRIDVSDNGIGFDERYSDRIFQVFQRLHGKQHYAGTGIGLAICEKVTANHGGAITAHSQPGEGSTFSVYLPIVPHNQ